MIVGLVVTGIIVFILSLFVAPIGTSNGLMIATVLLVLAIVLSVIKSKKAAK